MKKDRREYMKKYIESHKAQIAEYKRQWDVKNEKRLKRKRRKYYRNNRTKILENVRKYGEGHKEQRKQYRKQYEQLNKLDIRRKKRKYYLKNHEYFKAKARQNKRAKRLHNEKVNKNLGVSLRKTNTVVEGKKVNIIKENTKLRKQLTKINKQISNKNKQQLDQLDQLTQRVDQLQQPTTTPKPRNHHQLLKGGIQ